MVRSALADATLGGRDDYLGAVAALCGARLLLPVVAQGDDSGGGPDPSRHAEVVAVLMTSASGATGLVAFTGLDALRRFHAVARPVPCTLDELAASAQESGAQAVVIDVAGPHPLAVESELLGQLAAGRRLVRTGEGWGWLFAAPG